MFGNRILILVPHPDDEVVACAATIQRAQKEGAKIFALYLTTGCVGRQDLWPWQRNRAAAMTQRRRREAIEAARLLDITPLSFAERPTRSLRRNLHAAEKEIRRAIAENAIDQLWIPAYEGGHSDHDALSGLCSLLWPREKRQKASIGNAISNLFGLNAPEARYMESILEFSEYNFAGGQKHTQDFPTPNGTETILTLTAAERTVKRRALALYASETGNLTDIDVRRECFRPLALYDYAKPPHEGTVWYARFHWVPFRHPRIDFTTPADVCAALASFARAGGLPESAKPKGPERKEERRGSAE